mgnify:CR=1 FL=1
MNKKLNIVIRTLGVLAAIAAGVFAYLLKGKIETAMTATNFAVADAEIGAAKEFAPRMAEISAKTTALLTKKRERIVELEGNKKDLEADVAGKKTKIEESKMEGLSMTADERTNAIVARGVRAT